MVPQTLLLKTYSSNPGSCVAFSLYPAAILNILDLQWLSENVSIIGWQYFYTHLPNKYGVECWCNMLLRVISKLSARKWPVQALTGGPWHHRAHLARLTIQPLVAQASSPLWSQMGRPCDLEPGLDWPLTDSLDYSPVRNRLSTQLFNQLSCWLTATPSYRATTSVMIAELLRANPN